MGLGPGAEVKSEVSKVGEAVWGLWAGLSGRVGMVLVRVREGRSGGSAVE